MKKVFLLFLFFSSIIYSLNAFEIKVDSEQEENTWYNTDVSGTFSIELNYSWETAKSCTATCGGGTKLVTAICKSSDGEIVVDSLCTEPKPVSDNSACNTHTCPIDGVCGKQRKTCIQGRYRYYVGGSGEERWYCLGLYGGKQSQMCRAPAKKRSCSKGETRYKDVDRDSLFPPHLKGTGKCSGSFRVRQQSSNPHGPWISSSATFSTSSCAVMTPFSSCR